MTRFALSVHLMVLVSTGCASPPRLANTYSSPEALATALLEALARGDRDRLEALALTEREFKDHVWPDLPAARPERNLPFSYVWGDLHQKSQAQLAVTLKTHAGRRYHLEKVVFAAKTPYSSYLVHREASFVVKSESGAESTVRVCGSMIEKDGMWKVFSYVVDS